MAYVSRFAVCIVKIELNPNHGLTLSLHLTTHPIASCQSIIPVIRFHHEALLWDVRINPTKRIRKNALSCYRTDDMKGQ